MAINLSQATRRSPPGVWTAGYEARQYSGTELVTELLMRYEFSLQVWPSSVY